MFIINIKPKRTLWFVALLLIVALTAGCTDGEPNKVTIEFNEAEGLVKVDGESITSGYVVEVEPRASIQLEAVPAAEGLFFGGWEGVSESQEKQNPLKLSVWNDMKIKAIFTDQDPPGIILQEGFEQGNLNGWGFANAEGDVSKEHAKSGQYSAKVTTKGSGWNQFNYNFVGKVQSGKIYQISAWIYHEAGSDVEFHIVRLMNNEFKWLGGNVPIPTNQWTELTFTFEADPGIADQFILFIESYVEGLVYYVDDITLKLVE